MSQQDPFDPYVRLRSACACGRHASQAEHEQAASTTQDADAPVGRGLLDGVRFFAFEDIATATFALCSATRERHGSRARG